LISPVSPNLSNLDNSRQPSQNKTGLDNSRQLLDNSRQDYENVSERNLAYEIRQWVEESPGKFHVSDIDRELGLFDRPDKKNRSFVLMQLVEKGVIERVGAVRGHYQLIDRTCSEINFLEQSTAAHSLILPFELHKRVKVMPGNIILVAGERNSGKTTYVLQVLYLNNKNLSCGERLYFTSECPSELRTRLELFDLPLKDWNFKAFERSQNFHQVIKPDAVNIIDYLEIHTDFYAVGGLLAEIHNRLTTGIAIVCLQKNRGSDTGLGGARGLEKPRLYLSLSSNPPAGNTIKIVKAKSYVGTNPNGMELDFKLVAGWKLVPMTEWRHVPRKDNKP
jgi:hypothetical protein